MKYFNYKPIRLIELFAGVGSQAKALTNIGIDFEHWRICEFNENSIRSYNAIHDTDFVTSDITKISALDLGISDTNTFTYLLTYSFPCQDLSNTGKRQGMAKGDNTRSGLLWEVERLLNECTELPQVLLMENVPQVHSPQNIKHFEQWLTFLKSKGYSNYWKDLCAKDYGIPQGRNRCFMVSVLGDFTYDFPKPAPLNVALGDLLECKVDDSYYLTGVANPRGTPLQQLVCSKALNLTVPYEMIDFSFSNSRLKEIEQGYIKSRNKGDLKVSCTLTTSSSNFAIHLPSGAFRVLTPRECWRLMGFDDDDFEAAATVCNEKQLYEQAGNSIVVNVLMAIFSELFITKRKENELNTEMLDNTEKVNRTALADSTEEKEELNADLIDDQNIQKSEAVRTVMDFMLDGPRAEFGETVEDEATDLSDAPEEIKAEIIKNDELLKENETTKEIKEDEAMETPANIENKGTENNTTFSAVEQLRQLANERKALANLNTENPRFTNDVRALEYAVSVLEAVGL